jgi:hypothetical protein
MTEKHVLAIAGEDAAIRWGYHEAMKLARWTFTGSGSDGGTVKATVVKRDGFTCQQRPLVLALRTPDAVWPGDDDAPPWWQPSRGAVVKWPVRALVEEGATVTVHVGPVERIR